MNLQQLKYALEVGKCGSITKAAENLFVSQPNLSSSLKDLENEIGITLFSRSRKGMFPTTEGSQFLTYVGSIIDQLNSLESIYKQNKETGVNLRFASTRFSSGSQAFTELINKFPRNVPMNIHYKEMSHYEVLDAVAKGNAEIGRIFFEKTQYHYFTNLIQQNELEMEILWRNKAALLISNESPLAKEAVVTQAMLTDLTAVFYGDLETREISYGFIRNQLKVSTPDRNIYVSDRATLMDLLSNCPHTYFWILGTTEDILKRYQLMIKDVENTNMFFYEVLIYPKGKIHSKEVGMAIDQLKNMKPPKRTPSIY